LEKTNFRGVSPSTTSVPQTNATTTAAPAPSENFSPSSVQTGPESSVNPQPGLGVASRGLPTETRR
jgi:hypothetical protein